MLCLVDGGVFVVSVIFTFVVSVFDLYVVSVTFTFVASVFDLHVANALDLRCEFHFN